MQIAAYGRLGQDPRSIDTASGKPMAVSSIAVTLSDRRGQERTEWLGLVAFGRLAQLLLEHAKGDSVSVAGRVQINSYTAGTGETREELQVVADSLLSAHSARPGKSEASPADDRAPRTTRRSPRPSSAATEPAAGQLPLGDAPPTAEPVPEFDDEIPF